jgi:hypothetical protein
MDGRNQFVRNPRDESGWLIPRSGTVARKIYDLLKDGRPRKEIVDTLRPLKENGIDARIWRIKNPEVANAKRNKANAKRPKRTVMQQPLAPGLSPEAVAFFKGMAAGFLEAGLPDRAAKIEEDARAADRACRKHGLIFEARPEAFKTEPQ